MKDLLTGEVRLVSTDPEGTKAYGSFSSSEISTDGSRLVLTTTARLDARDEDTIWDVYVKDLTSGAVFLADTTREGEKANYGGGHGAISGDGTKAAFTTISTNLDPEDTDRNDDYDIYVKDLQTGELTLVSKGTSNYPKLSYNGMRVAFSSMATDLHPSDTEYYNDVYVTDLRTGSVMLASTTTEGGNVMPGDAVVGAISADGTRVAFHVDRGGFLDPRDTDSSPDVYVKDLGPTPPPENRPPDCSGVVVSPGVISPPARPRFTLVTLDGATDEDGDDLGYSITGVTQDEPVLAVGESPHLMPG